MTTAEDQRPGTVKCFKSGEEGNTAMRKQGQTHQQQYKNGQQRPPGFSAIRYWQSAFRYIIHIIKQDQPQKRPHEDDGNLQPYTTDDNYQDSG